MFGISDIISSVFGGGQDLETVKQSNRLLHHGMMQRERQWLIGGLPGTPVEQGQRSPYGEYLYTHPVFKSTRTQVTRNG